MADCNDERSTRTRNISEMSDKTRTNSERSDKNRTILDIDPDSFADPQFNYGALNNRIRSTQTSLRGLSNSIRSISPGFSWTHMSSAVGDSFNLHLQGALTSLTDAPSPDRASSPLLMSVNLQSIILGTSVLSIPFCVKIAGIWGLIMIVVVGLFSMFTADILSDCQYQKSYTTPGLNKRVYVSFVEMSRECWWKIGDYVMKIFVYLSLVRNVIVIILLTDIADDILHTMNVTGYDKKWLSVIWTLGVIPLLYITKVSVLAWVSFIGLNLYICVIVTVLVLCCMTSHTWDLTNISMDFNMQGFGIATGIIINSYSVHLNLPTLEGSLKNPDSYRKTSCISFIFNVIAKVGFAICGYLTYVSETGQEITSNINQYHPLPTLLRVSVMFFAYFSLPLQSHVVFELIDSTFKQRFPVCNTHEFAWLCVSRSLFMTMCLFVAVVIPDFSIVVSLIGSLRGSMIALVLPALFYTRLRTHDVDYTKKIVCWITAGFGLVAALIGVFSSVVTIAVGLGKH